MWNNLKLFCIVCVVIGACSFIMDTTQEAVIKITCSNRVNTEDIEVMQVVQLYENYLNSNPEIISDNSFWNSREKKMYGDFDFSRASMFQGDISAVQLTQAYQPVVLSVEKDWESYVIRVAYMSRDITLAEGSELWCIHKLIAIKEEGEWKLKNLLDNVTENWKSTDMGVINYRYSRTHFFDIHKAERAELFCKDFLQRFDLNLEKSFDFFMASDIDEMGLLENFDYYFVGITNGKSRENSVFSAKQNEFYPHEFVHQLMPINERRGHLIEEGLAEFLGSKLVDSDYNELLKRLYKDVHEFPEKYSLRSIMSDPQLFNGYSMAYPAGAAICEVVFASKGDDGLKQLMTADTSSPEKLSEAISLIMHVSFDEFETMWIKVLRD